MNHFPSDLRVGYAGRTLDFPAGHDVVVGRDSGCGVVVEDQRVSRRHAVLRYTAQGWWWEDTSTSGTWLDGRRLDRLPLTAPLTVRLGDPTAGPVLTVAVLAVQPAPTGWTPAPDARPEGSFVQALHVGPRLRIGRAADNDVIVPDDFTVSRHHAEVVQRYGALVLRDLGSAWGTFLDGRRIAEAPLADGALIGVGRSVFVHRQGRLEHYLDDAAGLVAHDLTVAVRGTTLLDRVSFAVEPGQVLAVLGTTGAGKTTLLRALTGFAPASSGRVLYGGRDLYAGLDELRRRIGYVPQDDILHTGLPLRRALAYSAQLRFASDTSAQDRAGRVHEVLTDLGLTDRAELPIATLSGGQRKRASVAVELLTRPTLLFLDEPTSGLDPGFERSVMQLLRTLADGGRTVVVITHSVASLDLCDRVAFLAPGGRLAYFGPPASMLTHFGLGTHAEVFQQVATHPQVDWVGAFVGTETAAEHLHEPLRRALAQTRDAAAAPASSARARGPGRLVQLTTIARRSVAVAAAARGYAIVLLAQAPLIALLLIGTLQTDNLAGVPGARPRLLLLLVVVAVVSMGLINSCREIVKELPIYRRERAVGLSPAAYLGAKVLCLSALAAIQTTILVAVVVPPQGAPERTLALLAVAIALAITATAMGLLISATARSEASALVLVPVLLVAQLVFAGAMFPTDDSPGLTQLGWLTPSHWGFRASAVEADLLRLDRSCLANPPNPDGPPCREGWRPGSANRVAANAPLVALAVAFAVGSAVLLRRQDPARG